MFNHQSYFKLLPDGYNFIVCGDTAAKYLRLTSINSMIHIYGEYELPPLPRFRCYVKDLNTVEWFEHESGIKCTTVGQTFIDLLQSHIRTNPQTLTESVWRYYGRAEKYKYDIPSLERRIRDAGYWKQYSEIKQDADEWGTHY